MHAINGNKAKKKPIKILHHNKSSALLKNRLDYINHILDEHKPIIAHFCESNNSPLNPKEENIPGFKKESKLIQANGRQAQLSRNMILIKNKVNYIRQWDLEDDQTAVIWIELKIREITPF